MAMAPESSSSRSSSSSKPLHNFALPPFLKWGSQRILPCKKLDNDADHHHRHPGSDRIEAIGHKLMLDYKASIDKVKVLGTTNNTTTTTTTTASDVAAVTERPWNLRTRRSPAPVPPLDKKKKTTPMTPVVAVGSATVTTPVVGVTKRLRGVSEKEEKVEFRVALRKEEIEEDFMLIAGIKPARRPKKRPRAVQKELDTLFPGLWLTEVTPQRYDVPEATE